MKKRIAAALSGALLSFAAGAHAERPFGYTEGPQGYTLFYHADCGVRGGKGWRRSMLVYPNGIKRDMCWRRDKNDIEACTIGYDGGVPHLSDECGFGDASAVLKVPPRAPRAFPDAE